MANSTVPSGHSPAGYPKLEIPPHARAPRPQNGDPATVTPSMDASRPHASQGRLSVIVVSIISGEPSDPRPAPILRLKLLSELSKGRAAGRAAALKGLGSTRLRTRHQPTGPTGSPDRDSARCGAFKHGGL